MWHARRWTQREAQHSQVGEEVDGFGVRGLYAWVHAAGMCRVTRAGSRVHALHDSHRRLAALFSATTLSLQVVTAPHPPRPPLSSSLRFPGVRTACARADGTDARGTPPADGEGPRARYDGPRRRQRMRTRERRQDADIVVLGLDGEHTSPRETQMQSSFPAVRSGESKPRTGRRGSLEHTPRRRGAKW